MKDNEKLIGLNELKYYVFFAILITFTMIGLTACAEGGSLEITNGHSAAASVGVSYAYEKTVWNKYIEPGEKETWTFDKDGKIEYVVTFDDNPGVMVGPKSFTIMNGEIKKVTIRP